MRVDDEQKKKKFSIFCGRWNDVATAVQLRLRRHIKTLFGSGPIVYNSDGNILLHYYYYKHGPYNNNNNNI